MPVIHHGTPTVSVPSSLAAASHVFLRTDTVRKPLTPPYEGPFLVIASGDKVFRILRASKEIAISVDRLKAAAVLSLPPANATVPAATLLPPATDAAVPLAAAAAAAATAVPLAGPSVPPALDPTT